MQTDRKLEPQRLTSEIDILRHNLGDDITLKALRVIYARYKILTSGEMNCRKCNTTLNLQNCSFERWAVRRESICHSCQSAKAKIKGEGQIPRAPDGIKCACSPCRKIKNSTTKFDTDVSFNPSTGQKSYQYLCASCNRSKQGTNHCKIHNFYFEIA